LGPNRVFIRITKRIKKLIEYEISWECIFCVRVRSNICECCTDVFRKPRERGKLDVGKLYQETDAEAADS
jgi:hypothetical protein